MTLYETTFVVRQDDSAANAKTIQEEMADVITKNGGKVLKVEHWGLRELAYEIKKNKKGHYFLLIIEAANATMQEFERVMSLKEEIIRSLTLKIDEMPEGDSIVLKGGEEELESA